MFLYPVTAYGADYEKQIDDIKEEYNIEIITEDSVNHLYEFTVDIVKKHTSQPISLFFKISAIIMLYSLADILVGDSRSLNVMNNICTLTVFTTLISPLKNILTAVSEKLLTVNNFMTTFLPVFAGINLASGEFSTAVLYNGFFLVAVSAVSQLCLHIIIPSVRIYFSIIVSDSLSAYIKLKSLADFYIKAVKALMKIMVSAICFFLTLQTIIGQGRDTLAVKTGKIIAGNAIPVIGSALQDAIAGVYAAMESIKGYAGAVGMSGVIMIFIPTIRLLAVYWLFSQILCIICDISGAQTIYKCMYGFLQITELLLAVVFLYSVMLIFSITIMIALTNGV